MSFVGVNNPYLPDKVHVDSFGQNCSYPGAIFNGSLHASFLTISHVHWITFVDRASVYLFLLFSSILPLRAVVGRTRLSLAPC